MAERSRVEGRLLLGLVLFAGVAGIGLAMLAGLVPELIALIAGPPPIVRAALAGLSMVVGGWLLLSAVRRIDDSMRRAPGDAAGVVDARRVTDADLRAMVRGVRLAFLAVASFTAAAGWLLGEALPLVIALVIAGVDVIETTFLLLVASRRA